MDYVVFVYMFFEGTSWCYDIKLWRRILLEICIYTAES